MTNPSPAKPADTSWAAPSPRPNRWQLIAWAVLMLAGALLSLRIAGSYQIGAYSDDAKYVVLAESLISAETYGMVNAPDEATAAQFPFVFPLLLTPFLLLYPGNPGAGQALSLLATLANAILLFWAWPWYSRRSYWWAVAVVGLYLLSPLAIDHTRRVMTEPIFTTFSLIALLLAEQAARGRQRRGWTVLLGITLTLVLFTRTIGLVLLVSIFAYLLYSRRRLFLAEMLPMAGTMIGLLLIAIVLTPLRAADLLPTPYLQDDDAVLLSGWGIVASSRRPAESVASPDPEQDDGNEGSSDFSAQLLVDYYLFAIRQHISEDIRQAVFPIGGGDSEATLGERIGVPSLVALTGVTAFLLVFIGFGRWLVLERIHAFNLYPIIYLLALVFWVWSGPRLLYPIQPQLQFAFLMGIEACILLGKRVLRSTIRRITARPNGAAARLGDIALIGIALLLVLLAAFKSFSLDDSQVHTGDLRLRSTWLRGNTAEAVVVMTEAPALDYLYSGRKTVPYPPLSAPEAGLAQYLAENGVDYIVVAPEIFWHQPVYAPQYSAQAAQLLAALPELAADRPATLVHSEEAGRYRVYRVADRE